MPAVAVHVPELPVLFVSGQGNAPGMVECPADQPSNAALASTSAVAVFLSRSTLMLLLSKNKNKAVAPASKRTMAKIIKATPLCLFFCFAKQ